MRRFGRVVAVAGLMAMAPAAPAQADIHGYPHFAGTCAIAGTATFSPAGGFIPAEERYDFTSGPASTCTGDLGYGGASEGNRTWKVAVTADNTGTISCAGSALQGRATGNAVIQFLNDDGSPATTSGLEAHPLRLEVKLDTYSVGTQVALVITGGRPARYAGPTMATGQAEFAADQGTIEQCLAGTVSSLDFTARITTGPSRRRQSAVPGFRIDRVLVSLRQT